MPPAIRVDRLSKRYHLGARAAGGYRTLRESLVEAFRGRWSRRMPAADGVDAFWALKDLSFEVQPGEVVGVIGRNGAGKSTLLKVLSRIAEPSAGRCWIRGRVGS